MEYPVNLDSILVTADILLMVEGVASSLDAALTAHELVKVRFSNKKSEVEDISRKLETATKSTLVAITGFTSVFFRQDPKSEDRIYRI